MNHKNIFLLNAITVIYGLKENFSFKKAEKHNHLENIRRLDSFHLVGDAFFFYFDNEATKEGFYLFLPHTHFFACSRSRRTSSSRYSTRFSIHSSGFWVVHL